MVFNSGVFIYFFAVVFAVYWLLQGRRRGLALQNGFLLVASYFFYGYWDWLFLVLIFVSTVVDYTAAILIDNEQDARRRRLFISVSVIVNLGILGIFKYYDFFIESFVAMWRGIDPSVDGSSLLLRVILPVGISFYTFQTMSYTIDVYRRQIPAERDFLNFALFVCFFPQLVAGPIERAKDLISQIRVDRRFDFEDLAKGAWLILLGFYMKVYVADTLGPLVDKVYLSGAALYRQNPDLVSGHGGAQVLAASVGFAFQIYCDFAGYSNIALGSALMLGFRLTTNFDAPELSQNPAELWRRWHITLNRWVTDYIYIPLGGSRLGAFQKHRNLFFAFVLMGLWHGANWTFVFWGIFHGAWLVLYEVFKSRLPKLPPSAPAYLRGAATVSKMVVVFFLFGLSATFFRAYDAHHVAELWKSILSFPYSAGPVQGVFGIGEYVGKMVKVVFLLLVLDVMAYRRKSLFWIFEMPLWIRAPLYAVLFFTVVTMGVFGRDVIYFAF